MNIKIAHISDLHLCPLSHIPSSRTASFHEDVKKEFCDLFEQLKQDGVSLLCVSGDLFHIKSQSAYSPKDLNYYTALFKSFDIPTYAIAGNHDLPKSLFSNIEDSPYRNLLNSLAGSWNDLSLKFISWDLEDKKLVLAGIPYAPSHEILKTYSEAILQKLNQEVFSGQTKKENIFICLLTHIDAFPDEASAKFWKGLTFEELGSYFPYANILLNGHIHCSFNPYQTNLGLVISKPWSVGRVVRDYFNQENDLIKHVPSYSLIELTPSPEGWGLNLWYKPITCKPFSQVFIPESLKRELDKNLKVQNFVESLKSGVFDKNSGYFNLVNPDALLAGMNLSNEVRAIIEEYLRKE